MYYNLLSEIKNAVNARKERISFPFSQMDFAVAKVLAENGYLKSAEKEAAGRKSIISVKLAYQGKKGALNGFRIISKPSRHFYTDYRTLRSVKQGHGIGVLSTSKGIMSSGKARKEKVGGEYLFEIW